MGRFHYYRQELLTNRIKPWLRIWWLDGEEWKGILLVIGRHEFGFRIGEEKK